MSEWVDREPKPEVPTSKELLAWWDAQYMEKSFYLWCPDARMRGAIRDLIVKACAPKWREEDVSAWAESMAIDGERWPPMTEAKEPTKEDRIYQALRRLIKGKKRSRELIEKYARILSPETIMGLHGEQAMAHRWWREERLRDMFREAGVEVEDE